MFVKLLLLVTGVLCDSVQDLTIEVGELRSSVDFSWKMSLATLILIVTIVLLTCVCRKCRDEGYMVIG